MPDFGRGADRRNSSGPESLDAIAQTDLLLDAIANQRRVRPADRADAELFALLEGWRDEIRWPSAAGLITEADAAAALHDGLAARPAARGRGSRRLTLVASAAAAVLAIGGFGALVGGAQPGDSMYSLHTALFGESESVRDDRVMLAAQTEMAEVQQMIERGDWEQAQEKLQAVSGSVESVGNVDTKTQLVQQWNELSVKVGTRDPNATVPVVVAGEPVAPPPPGVTLLELPAVTASTTAPTSEPATEPSTDPSTGPTSDTPTTSVTPGESTAPASTTVPTDATTTEPSTAPTSTTEPSTVPTTTIEAPAPTTPPSSGPATPSTTPSAASQTLTSSVAPSSVLPTTTSVAPAVELPPSTVQGAPSSAVVVTTTVAESPRTAESAPTHNGGAPAFGGNGGGIGSGSRNGVGTPGAPRQVIELPIPGFG